MNDRSDARILRLERLESRWLLASGLFEFGMAVGNSDSGHSHRQHESSSSRPDEVARHETRSDRSERSHGRRDAPPQIQSDRPHERGQKDRHSVPVDSSPTQQSPATQNQSVPIVNTPAANTAFAGTRAPETTPAISSIVSTRPESSPRSSPEPTSFVVRVDASKNPIERPDAGVVASEQITTATEANADEALAQAVEEASTIDTAHASRIIAADRLDTEQADRFSPTIGNASTIDDGGYIDLTPLEVFESSIGAGSHSEPWQLDLQTIPSLRQIAENTIGEQVIGDRTELVDQMMKDWFQGPGGLIAFQQVNLPANAFPLEPAMIDVGIESTIALHRSLDLVAGNVAPALSGPVLDAIMASLEEVAASEAQPVIQPSPLRVPTAAYPAIAVVATTIAVSARRKHKQSNGNLQFTDGE